MSNPDSLLTADLKSTERRAANDRYRGPRRGEPADPIDGVFDYCPSPLPRQFDGENGADRSLPDPFDLAPDPLADPVGGAVAGAVDGLGVLGLQQAIELPLELPLVDLAARVTLPEGVERGVGVAAVFR